MVSRLGNLVLAIFVMSAPVSLTMCKVLCASTHEGAAHAVAQSMHSCHDAKPSESAGAISTDLHVCGHADELPVSSIAAADVAAPPPAQATFTPSLALLAVEPRAASIETSPGPPSQHSSLPLRI